MLPFISFQDRQKSVEPLQAAVPAFAHFGTLLGRQVTRNSVLALVLFI